MGRSVSASEIFDALKDRFSLHWAAGQSGESRTLQALSTLDLRPSLAGFLNLIHPNNVQILGREEIEHLDGLESRQRWETVAEIVAKKPTALLVCEGQAIPNDLTDGANESGTPLWTSPSSGVELASHLQHMLSRMIAQHTSVHGVFMEVFSIGVLITGDSGAGKSELALELITRGHRLVADDAPQLTLVAPDVLEGSCPALLQDCLEVRGLGILNVREMFGDSAIQPNKYLRLVIHLQLMDREAIRNTSMDRLHGDISTREFLNIPVPVITIPVAPGRNIAVLVEAAVRNHSLKLKGIDSAANFIARHAASMVKDAP